MMQLMGIPPSARVDPGTRRWYGPWRCAWCRHRRLRQVSAEGSSSVAVPAGLAPSPAPLPCGAAPACAAASASLPSASAPASPALNRRRIPRECSTNSSAQSASHADGWPDRSRQPRKRPAKTSPRSEASSRTAVQSLPSTSRRSIRPRISDITALAISPYGRSDRTSSRTSHFLNLATSISRRDTASMVTPVFCDMSSIHRNGLIRQKSRSPQLRPYISISGQPSHFLNLQRFNHPNMSSILINTPFCQPSLTQQRKQTSSA